MQPEVAVWLQVRGRSWGRTLQAAGRSRIRRLDKAVVDSQLFWWTLGESESPMIRKLATGEYRLYSRKKNPKTGKRRNLGTFKTRAAAEKHERAVQYFKRR